MRRSLLPGTLIVFLLVAPAAAAKRPHPQHAGQAPKASPVTEPQALTLLANAIEKDAVYAPMPLACMTFIVEDRAPDAFGIAAREKHGGRCRGDVKTAPVLDRFKVDRSTGAITVYDVLEDEYYTWAEFRKHRAGQGQ